MAVSPSIGSRMPGCRHLAGAGRTGDLAQRRADPVPRPGPARAGGQGGRQQRLGLHGHRDRLRGRSGSGPARLAAAGRCAGRAAVAFRVTPLDFEQLFDASGALFPEGVRSRVEATFRPLPRRGDGGHPAGLAAGPLGDLGVPDDDLLRAPCSGAATGHGALDHLQDLWRPWTMWHDADADAVNAEWHRAVTAVLKPFNVGYYIGETNTVEQPEIVAQAFTPEKWRRGCATCATGTIRTASSSIISTASPPSRVERSDRIGRRDGRPDDAGRPRDRTRP